ncbi:MAG: hypothetical protein J7603_11695 [Pseudacidovorax sp.]|nr:hypothetical protein [Pseudacidovorax sp.]
MSIKPLTRVAARRRGVQGPSRSLWWPVVRKLFATLQEVPIAALSALSVMAGAAMVHRYCVLIGYGPEASVSISFGAAVALVVLLGLVSLGILLQAPAWMPPLYELPRLGFKEAVVTQSVAFLSLFVWAIATSTPSAWEWIVGLAIALVVLAGVLVSLVRAKGAGWRRAGLGVLAAGMGCAPALGALIVILKLGVFDPEVPAWGFWLATLAVLGLIIVINALPGLGKNAAFVSAALVVVGLVVIGVAGRSGFIAKSAATAVGLRIDGESQLRVKRAACLTLLSAVPVRKGDLPFKLADEAAGAGCREYGNAVTARVDLRGGGRWVLQVHSINGWDAEPAAPRVSVADSAVELVLRPMPEVAAPPAGSARHP